jgi:hypothetical protein
MRHGVITAVTKGQCLLEFGAVYIGRIIGRIIRCRIVNREIMRINITPFVGL